MLKLSDKKVTRGKLNKELQVAGLPVSGVARLSRETDENGRAVLGPDGKIKKVAPYLLIKGDFTAAQETAIQAMVDTHVPDAEPTLADIEDARKESILDDPGTVALHKRLAKKESVTYETIRAEVKAEL